MSTSLVGSSVRIFWLVLCFAGIVGAQERSYAKAVELVRDGDLEAARRALPEKPENPMQLTLPEYAALCHLPPSTAKHLRPLARMPAADAPLVKELQRIARQLESNALTDKQRAEATASAQRLGTPAVHALIAVLEAPDPRTAREAARILGKLADPRAVAALSAALGRSEGGAESNDVFLTAIRLCTRDQDLAQRELPPSDQYLLLAVRYLSRTELETDCYLWGWRKGLIAEPVDPLLASAERATVAAEASNRIRRSHAATALLIRATSLRRLLSRIVLPHTKLERLRTEIEWGAYWLEPEPFNQALIPPPDFAVHAAILEGFEHVGKPRCVVPAVAASLWSDSGLVRNRAIIVARALTRMFTGEAASLPFDLPAGDPDSVEAARKLLLAADLSEEEAARVQRAIEQAMGGMETAIPLGPNEVDLPPDVTVVAGSESAEPKEVVVFYGTDRAVFSPDFAFYASGYLWAAIAAVLAFVLPRLIRWMLQEHLQVLAPITRWIGWAATALLVVSTTYGSVRTHIKHTRLGFEYGGKRGPFDKASGPYCHLGTCVVGIPPGHVSGEVERPQPLTGDLWEDPDRHVVLLSIRPENDAARYFGQVRDRAKEGGNSAFVFVHGFNVTFEDAALRTAQMTHDLNFQGAPMFFSWPSRGSLLGYTADESTVAWATRHLKRFLRDVRAELPTATIHLVAHSMGNRALTEALRRLAREIEHDGLPRFQEVVLAAPDIDAATFRNDIVPAIRSTAERVTLYASSADEALTVSKTVHGYPRAGDSGELIIVVDGIQTIDVSAELNSSILGHSYYGSEGRVLDDLIALLRKRRKPSERGLAEVLSKGGVHWRLE